MVALDIDGTLFANVPSTGVVEETIRDVEADIARFISLDKLDRAFAAQNADEAKG